MNEPEKRYTLNEARLELNKAECGRRGHSWEIVEHGGGHPVAVWCECCGRSWKVGEENKP